MAESVQPKESFYFILKRPSLSFKPLMLTASCVAEHLTERLVEGRLFWLTTLEGCSPLQQEVTAQFVAGRACRGDASHGG